MDREKEIKEMMQITSNVTDELIVTPWDEAVLQSAMEALLDAGYCKATEIYKKVLQDIDNLAAQYGLDAFRAIGLRKYAKQLGVKVDE